MHCLSHRNAGFPRIAILLLLLAGACGATEDNSAWQQDEELAAAVAYEETPDKPAGERSILVAKDLVSPQAAPFESGNAQQNLEPIAKNTEYEPDLAEPESLGAIPEPAPPLTEVNETPERLAEPATPEPRDQELANDATETGEDATTDIAQVPLELEPVTFHGITPGISLRNEVLSDWGEPRSEDSVSGTLTYELEGLQSVVVSISHDRVKSITIQLGEPLTIREMVGSLELESLPAVATEKEAGKPQTKVYPERGVVLTLTEESGLAIATDGEPSADQPHVSQVLLEAINPDAFYLRARETGNKNLAQTVSDLERVVELERNSPAAKYLLAKYYLALGKAVTAERNAAEAVELEPNNADYRLEWTECLSRLARYDQAVVEARKVLDTPHVKGLHKAQALKQLGDLAALGTKEVAQRAIPLYSRAIEAADEFANLEQPEIRHAAQCILIDAHLAIATQIAQGSFQEKNQAVLQWIERASALAEALIEEDSAYLPYRLQIAVSALSAATSLEKPIHPNLWVEEAEQTVRFLEGENADSLTCSQYDWQLGLVYLHAADIEHLRSQVASAKKYGKLAERVLSEQSRQRDELPDTGYTMGRLYFQIGAVYAVHEQDHATACKWYDQAAELLLNPVPVTTLAIPQQHGDALVSMGVSYWKIKDFDRAVELTQTGVELIERAVDTGLLGSATLAVPYGNLSAMYQALGKTEPAGRYQQLAQKVAGGIISE
jgi:tetratricopeptide (TPR) repeat protein